MAGRYPDLAGPHGADAVAVRAVVERQARELTPDPFMLALSWVETPVFDELMAAQPVDAGLGTDLLPAFAGSQAWRGARPAPAGPPTFAGYCPRETARGFAGVARRLATTAA